MTIAFVDLDNFREVNKSGGDDHGDRVLAKAAGVMRDACRPGDVVYRNGGEEFVVTIPGADSATGAQIAERLRETIERQRIPRGPDPSDGYLTLSIGVASLTENEPGSIFDALLVASRRMFNAKERGRNRSSGGTSQKMGPLTSEAASGPGAARVREVILMGLNLSSSEYDRGHPRSVRSVRSQQREHIPSPACGCR
jgi:diguanylate cyclase (GGDEF)-like protein